MSNLKNLAKNKYIFILTLFLLSSNLISQDYGVSFKPYFCPFKIVIGTNGVSLKGDHSIVTPIGQIGFWTSLKLTERPMKIENIAIEESDLLVIIRDIWSNEGDHLFKIENGAHLSVVLDGRNEITIKEGVIIIDISQGEVLNVKFRGENAYLDDKILNYEKLQIKSNRDYFGTNFKKTSKFKNIVDEYKVSTKLINHDPTLIFLIYSSSTNNTKKKKFWFNLYNAMDQNQINKLYNILLKEAIGLAEIDKKYEDPNYVSTPLKKKSYKNLTIPNGFKPLVTLNKIKFSLIDVYEKKDYRDWFGRELVKSQLYEHCMEDYNIFSSMTENDLFLVYLILITESLDTKKHKQEVFNMYSLMNSQQIDHLINLLLKEKIELLIIDYKYKK